LGPTITSYFAVEGCTLYLVRACHHDSVTVVHQEVLCTNICLDSCAPQICFAWRDLTTTDTNVILLPMTCEQETARKLQFSIHDQIASLAEQQSAEIGRVYDSACGGVETLHDLFRLDYEVNLYHFTLYYYDRAGHLVRTVPPAGVRLVSPPSRATVPSHVMVTTYEYNSLGQPIAKNTPDGGTTTFYYDAKQRLRFSQDARQAALYPQRYSYQQYDSLSRVVESGEAMEYTSMYVAVEDFRTLVDTMNYPVRGKTEWTKTTYTTQTGLHYLHDDTSTVRAQRHLRNRVSSRKTYQGVETVYSYDPYGNVAWVYQNLPGLGGNFIGYEYDLISNRVKQVLYDAHHGDQFYQRYGYDEDGRVTTVESSRDSVIWDRDAEYSYFLHGPLMRIELGEDRLQGLDYTHTIHGWLKAINHPALSIDTTLDPGHDNGMERTAPDVFGMILNYYEGDYLRSYNSGADQSPFNSKTVGSSTEQAYQLTSRNLYNGNISGWSLRTTPVGTPSIPAGQTAPALLTHESLVGYSFRYDVLNRLRTSSFSYYSQGSTSAWNNMGTADYYMSLAYDPNGNIDSMTRHGYAKPGGNVAMDKLTYSYPTTPGAENNRLRHVKDSESAGYYANDIDDEPDDNYLYDPSGNLIYDQSDGTLIRWNAQGKVTQVRKITATVKKDIIYVYDGAGERIAKKDLDYLASGDSSWVTYYVRDAGEKVIAVYRQKLHYNGDSIPCPPGVPGSGSDFDADGFDETPPDFCDNCNSTQSPSLPPEYSRRNPWQEDYDGDGIGDACDPCPFGPGDECGTPLSDTAVVRMSKWIPSGFAVLAEWHIYGSSIQGRVGISKPEKNRDTSLVSDTIFTRILTMKEYELKDHLGNVTVVISDLKTATTGGGAPFGVDVKSFSHYYPFGMLQPAAYGSNREYRFGYNGKESDNDWKGEGNVYDYGFRVYDPRIAKFLSVDPLAPEYPWYTPYQFAGNMPISMIDRDGLEPAPYLKENIMLALWASDPNYPADGDFRRQSRYAGQAFEISVLKLLGADKHQSGKEFPYEINFRGGTYSSFADPDIIADLILYSPEGEKLTFEGIVWYEIKATSYRDILSAEDDEENETQKDGHYAKQLMGQIQALSEVESNTPVGRVLVYITTAEVSTIEPAIINFAARKNVHLFHSIAQIPNFLNVRLTGRDALGSAAGSAMGSIEVLDPQSIQRTYNINSEYILSRPTLLTPPTAGLFPVMNVTSHDWQGVGVIEPVPKK
jgi:RHS repeat-associated protein